MSDAAHSPDVSDLPDDPAVLKALLATERSLRIDLAEEVARLATIVQAFKRAMFGPRSEKLDPVQLELALEDAEQEFAEARAETDATDPARKTARAARRRANRGRLPKHLPRIETTIEPERHDCPCCGGALHRIGEDDVIPAQFRVLVTRRPKYACSGCAEGRGRTKTGWLWGLARDDRTWGGGHPPAIAFLYADGRGGEHATRHLDASAALSRSTATPATAA